MTDTRNLQVTHLRTNAKGGFFFDLSPCTLIVGQNGHGKSGVLAALELPLTGDSSAFGKIGARIMEMADPEKEFRSSIMLSDGKTLTFTVTGSISRASKPLWLVGGEPVGKSPAVILSDEVSTLMNKKTDKALRAALLDITVGDIDPGVITQEIPDAFQKTWEPVWTEAIEGCETVADAILTARKALDKRLKDIRDRKKVDLGSRPSAPDQAGADALRQRVWGIRQKLELAKQNAATPGEVVGGPGYLTGMPGLVPLKPAPLPIDLSPALRGAIAARDAVDASVKVLELMKVLAEPPDEISAVPCLTCRQPTGFTAAEITGLLVERYKQAKAVAVNVEMLREMEQRVIQRALQREDPGAPAVAALSTPSAPPPPPTVPDFSALEAELVEAERAMGDGLAACSAQESWDQAALQKRKAEGDEKVVKALRESVDAAIGTVLQGRVTSFENTATGFLPEGERLKIALVSPTGKAMCRVGIEGGHRPGFRTWRSMCGAERARGISAISAAWGRGREEPIRIGMLDEVWLGTKALIDVCEGLRKAVDAGGLTQAIVFAVRADETPEGWTRVEI